MTFCLLAENQCPFLTFFSGIKPKLYLPITSQKCRITKYIAESREGKSENNFDTMPEHDLNTGKRISEAYRRTLQMQLNVQKRLLQQLEMQRSLQMKIEEQGRQLKRFLEQSLYNKNSAPQSDPPAIHNF
ncbi:myb family transcription factor PHL5-like isoform X3 [Rhodamnia argentea]|uniref:Myb family transcription factor PHL5-like isoform X3 n=1 Tax=Rhodamnia argentea TaxID=178133 RepID=A0ABM3HE79_9MYRT|nr:myb family transcription factor PHL5-like isoform X3 [Rhodamnia argentea]